MYNRLQKLTILPPKYYCLTLYFLTNNFIISFWDKWLKLKLISVQRIGYQLIINHLCCNFIFYYINVFFRVQWWPTLEFMKHSTSICLELKITTREDVITVSEVSRNPFSFVMFIPLVLPAKASCSPKFFGDDILSLHLFKCGKFVFDSTWN